MKKSLRKVILLFVLISIFIIPCNHNGLLNRSSPTPEKKTNFFLMDILERQGSHFTQGNCIIYFRGFHFQLVIRTSF
jgi:hypothetical protein